MKFDFIAKNAGSEFDIKFMCNMLEVSRSGFYAFGKRGITRREAEDVGLIPEIHAAFREHRRGCGSRMVLGALRSRGIKTSRKRVVRLMREENLQCRLKRRFVRTTHVERGRRCFPKNILNRQFAVGAPNKVWAGDITYIQTKRGWAYLAALLDLGSRKVIGWSVASTMDEQLPLRALQAALRERRTEGALLHHSDRGSQYAGFAYQETLTAHGVTCSMSRNGECWDNACVESFFSTLKRELPNDHVFDDAAEVESAVFAYIEGFYNSRRLHSTLGYRTPIEYENQTT